MDFESLLTSLDRPGFESGMYTTYRLKSQPPGLWPDVDPKTGVKKTLTFDFENAPEI